MKQYTNSTQTVHSSLNFAKRIMQKKLHVFTFFILLFTFSCTDEGKQELVDQNLNLQTETRTSCPPPNVEKCLQGTLVRNFMVDNCPIYTIVTYYICPSGIVMNPPVWSYGQGAGCLALKKKLSDAYSNPYTGPTDALAIYNSIVKSISLQAQNAILNSIAQNPSNPFICNSTPCNPSSYSIKAQMSDCIKLCATWESDGEDSGIWNLSEVVCGNACCERSTPFCIRPDKTICLGTPSTSQTSTCDPVASACPSGSIPGQTCSPPCDRL